MNPHPLDRAVWNALSGRQSALAHGDARARRLDSAIGPFAASADDGPEAQSALAALIGAEEAWFMEPAGFVLPPSLRIVRQAAVLQMVGEGDAAFAPPFACAPLAEEDAPAMLALATLTNPGPFRAGTWRYGGFLGVKRDGELVAMAGTRMRPPGHVEVSGVCTHPEHRGRGYAAGLMRAVAAAIAAAGDRPFLTCYAAHGKTVALYESLGYRTRAELVLTVVKGAQAA